MLVSDFRLSSSPCRISILRYSTRRYTYSKMGRKKNPVIPEEALLLSGKASELLTERQTASTSPAVDDSTTTRSTVVLPLVDTHTHLISTFSAYRSKYPSGNYSTVHEFARAYYAPTSDPQGSSPPVFTPRVTKLVDVFCEAPVLKAWKDLADSAITEEQRTKDWGGIEYHFVIGVHPHEAKHYTDEVEKELCVITHRIQATEPDGSSVSRRPSIVDALGWAKWVWIIITTTHQERYSEMFFGDNLSVLWP